MSGIYDRFNKGLSNGIRAVDVGEEMIARRIIQTDLLEMVKLMEMHQEGREAEKAKWRKFYYSTLKEKDKVVHEEEEKSLEIIELESDDEEESLEVTELESEPMMEPQLPSSLLSASQLSPPPSPSQFTPALGFEKRNEATILFMASPNHSVRKLGVPLFDNHIPPVSSSPCPAPPPLPFSPLPLAPPSLLQLSSFVVKGGGTLDLIPNHGELNEKF
ncbi:unnamed protein product [Lactuca virosa]|uniref:Uncharacterized protein n=1 Tax=Lactuca virosa TaxID=75947 RepID=A0AAU9N8N5_9ASTR|nr:unnamed protein product [Lactuca virosa]